MKDTLKPLFTFTLVALLLAGCSGKTGESTASFDFKLAGLASIQEFAGGGAMLIGRSVGTNNHFARRVDNFSEGTLSLELPNGVWDFALIMWDGDHDRDGIFSDAIIPLTGKVRCGDAGDVLLDGSEVTVSLTANNTNCSDDLYGDTIVPDGFGGIKFREIAFRQCRGGVATVTDPLAADCGFADTKGFYGSIRIMIAPFREGAIGNFVATENAIMGPCINTIAGSSADINDYEFIDGSSAIPTVPVFKAGDINKVRTFIRGYYDVNCSEARGITDVPFVGPLSNKSGPLAKTFIGGAAQPTIVLGTPDALGCAGVRGSLVSDFSFTILGSTATHGICNASQFDLIAPDFQTGATYQNDNFILMNDINYFAGQNISPSNPPNVPNFSMIGDDIGTNPASSQPYNGTFYGNNKIITGLRVDIEDSAGPISDVGFVRRLAGSVRDLTFILTEIETNERDDHSRIGTVAGTLSGGTIENISIIYGSVEGRTEIGLFTGRMEASASITFVDSIDSEVEGVKDVGGITGYADGSSISFAEFEGVVELDSNSPDEGFCQDPSEYFSLPCTTSLSFESFGGLVGKSINSNILSSTSKGVVVGGARNGGLIGYSDAGSIADSYSIMTVLGTKHMVGFPTRGETGGVIGESGGGTGITIDRVFHTMGTIAHPNTDQARVNPGVGQATMATGGGGPTVSAALTPTPAEYNNFRNNANYMIGQGFTSANGWQIDDSGFDIPRLDWESVRDCSGKFNQTFAGGDGSSANPYQICSAQQFVNMSANLDDANLYYVLMRPIDMVGASTISSTAIVPNGANAGKLFQGVFDGNNMFINNVSVANSTAATNPVGLFQEIGVNGVVENIIVIGRSENLGITGKPQGLIAGVNRGLIDRAIIFGSVESGAVGVAPGVGPAAGSNFGVVAGVQSQASVKAHRTAGGIVGENQGGLVIYSSASGKVTPSRNDRVADRIGGLVGYNIPFNGTKSFYDEVNDETFSYNGSIIQSKFDGELSVQYGPAAADLMVFTNAGLIAGHNDGTIEDVQSYGRLDMSIGTDPTFLNDTFNASTPDTIANDQIAIIATGGTGVINGSLNETWGVGDLIYKNANTNPVRIPGPHGVDTGNLTAGTDTISPFFNVGLTVGSNGASGTITRAFINGNSQASGGNYYSNRFGSMIGSSANATPITDSIFKGELAYPGSNDILFSDASNIFIQRNIGANGRLLVYVDDATFDGTATINLNSANDFNLYGLAGSERVILGNYYYDLNGAVGTTSAPVLTVGISDTVLGGLYVPDDVDFNSTNYSDFFAVNLGWDVGSRDLGSVWEEESGGNGYSAYLTRYEQYEEYPQTLDYIDLVSGGAPSSTGNTLSPNPISLDVTNGPAAGGTTFVITGTNLIGIQSVSVGPYPCATFVENGDGTVNCVTDAGVAGTYDVIVTNDFGETGVLTNGFTYNP